MFSPPSPVKEEKEKVRHVLVGTLSLSLCVKSSQTAILLLLFCDKILNNSPTKLW
jgi:hypothetical protein